MATVPLLSARGLVKSFGGRRILDGLDLDVADGARIGVLGPNGGGKSTLLRILAGLETPDTGDVRIADVDVTRSHPRDRGIGFDMSTVEEDRHGVRGSIIGRMERHGGRVEIRSQHGEGTEVRLHLPRREENDG